MFCDNCKIDRIVNDFINNQKFCYHCVYRIKLEKIEPNRTKTIPTCRTCGKSFVKKNGIKKRQRTVFCSEECAKKGHKHQLINHWTRKMRAKNSGHSGEKSKWKTNHY